MEVVQGKSNDKKIVIAQEIAFAKVLSGNNKTLRDKALKKLKKWLTVRGNGNWAFTEDEFIRIWTGLFYCMWMSDKFLVQEEIAESISKLIHCFGKSSENALLFIKCFNKRILMEWEGLDQYRIDKFNMLIRRFLRQTFEYCKEKEWDKPFLLKLTDIFYNIVLHRDNSLGFVLHFINIYAEELAKVSKGKLENEIILILIEPFVKLISQTKEQRIMSEAEEFFNHLMRQTDIGIDFEEKFNEWKKQGFPGQGPECLQKVEFENVSVDTDEESCEEEGFCNEPLDPRAGSVHVFLPQIPFDTDAVIQLFKKYEHAKPTTSKGRKKLRLLSRKFASLKKGKFPENIKKDPILDEKTKKRRQTKRNAKLLLEFTKSLDNGPVKTQDLKLLEKELNQQSEEEEPDNNLLEGINESESLDSDESNNNEKKEENMDKGNCKKVKNIINKNCAKSSKNFGEENNKFKKKFKETNEKVINLNGNNEVKKKKKSRSRRGEKNAENIIEEEKVYPSKNKNQESVIKPNEDKISTKLKANTKDTLKLSKKNLFLVTLNSPSGKELTPLKKEKAEGVKAKSSKKQEHLNGIICDDESATPKRSFAIKRKILSNWQVQELDSSNPEYYKIKTPKIVRIERKLNDSSCLEENQEPNKKEETGEGKTRKKENKEKNESIPVFWSRALVKSNTKKNRRSSVFVNPFSETNEDLKSPNLRRISFALDKNMAQENAEYLEEVKNSPKVPFDGSRKPIQSALKSGLTPSPINPFYRLKKIKLA